MAMMLSEAERILEEGRQARKDEITEVPYPIESSQAFWWARGWKIEHDTRKEEMTCE